MLMKKVLLVIMLVISSALCFAQQDKLWMGDFRIGISGGANYILAKPHYNLGAQMSLRESERKITPNIGLYLGMQKDWHRSWLGALTKT